MDAPCSWEQRKHQIRLFIASGQAVEAMKELMYEMKSFSDRPCIFQLNLSTSAYYSNPAEFGISLKMQGGPKEDVAHFCGILKERGLVFEALGQPLRGLRDLEAAQELASSADVEIKQGIVRCEAAMEAEKARSREAEEARRIPVTILTGFLGAGKTTLLNYILRARHGKKFAVIENEVGQVGIDNQLLDDNTTSMRTAESITLLDNGCLCCTVRDDLLAAVKQILQRAAAAAQVLEAVRHLDGIIIETTGLADPGPVCKTFYFDEDLRARTRIDGVLTLVDARHFLQQLRRVRTGNAVNESAQQVGFADKVLLNKVDAVSADALEDVEKEVRKMNQVCPIVRCCLSQRPDEVPIMDLLGVESFSLDRVLQEVREGEGQAGDAPIMPPAAKRLRAGETISPICKPIFGFGNVRSRHDSGIGTFTTTVEGAPLVLNRFMEVMNSIRAERPEDLFRYKGIICVKEPSGAIRRAIMQGVHDMCTFEPRGLWPEDQPKKTQVVFIGRNLDQDLWIRLFAKCKEGYLE